jgi:thiamine biosynthesis protein ThiI
VGEEESRIDPSWLETAIAQRKTLDLRELSTTDLVAPYLFTDEIPHGAVVLDCRPAQQYRIWHLPGAQQRDEWELLRDFKRLDRERTYVLYCASGVQTAYLAERMQRAGYEAYSFRGGVRALMRKALR